MFKINIKAINYTALLSVIITLLAVIIVQGFVRNAQPAQAPMQQEPRAIYYPTVNAAKDYQLQLMDDGSTTVWNGKEYIGFIPYNTTCTLNRILQRDHRK